ncbi:MAG: LLM class flavin-dependent oxidoreductase [Rhodospirillales bacterium]
MVMRRTNDDSLLLGTFYPSSTGVHVVSRAISEGNPNPFDPKVQAQLSAACEEAGLDYIFLADRWSPFGPHCTAAMFQDPFWYAPMLVAALATTTRHVGLVSTIHTTYHRPEQAANYGAMLDQLSGGRWGVNIVTGFSPNEAGLFGLDNIGHDDRYAMAEDFIDAMKHLWAGNGGTYVGPYYRLDANAASLAPLQRQPLLINAGASAAGLSFAGKHADWIFLTGADGAEIKAKIAKVNDIARERGRAESSIRAMMHANLIVRDSDDEALALGEMIRQKVDFDAAREFAAELMGGMETYRRVLGAQSEHDRLVRVGSRGGGQLLHGSPRTVVADIIRLREEYGCRGLAFSFPIWSPDEVRTTLLKILPLLAEAGVWTSPYERGWSW